MSDPDFLPPSIEPTGSHADRTARCDGDDPADPEATRPSKRTTMVFGIATAIGAVVGVFAVVALALLERPHAATVLLGSGMVAMGILRGVWPGRPWFSARTRWSDALVFGLVGVVILWLSPWTAQVPPG